MGKAHIINNQGNGLYTVELAYDLTAIEQRISKLETLISDLIVLIAGMPDGSGKTVAELNLQSYRNDLSKQRGLKSDYSDVQIAAWCGDLTKDLTGEVGTIEVARVLENGLNIYPGYNGGSDYDGERDGVLTPLLGQGAAATFYNLAMQPAAQKWKPVYRYATINSIDKALDVCSVQLFAEDSQLQGIDVNQDTNLTDVTIEYMTCNAVPFAVNDEVLVKFENMNFLTPKVIGFKDHPQPCGSFVMFRLFNVDEAKWEYTVYDWEADERAELKDDRGVEIEQPFDDTKKAEVVGLLPTPLTETVFTEYTTDNSNYVLDDSYCSGYGGENKSRDAYFKDGDTIMATKKDYLCYGGSSGPGWMILDYHFHANYVKSGFNQIYAWEYSDYVASVLFDYPHSRFLSRSWKVNIVSIFGNVYLVVDVPAYQSWQGNKGALWSGGDELSVIWENVWGTGLDYDYATFFIGKYQAAGAPVWGDYVNTPFTESDIYDFFDTTKAAYLSSISGKAATYLGQWVVGPQIEGVYK